MARKPLTESHGGHRRLAAITSRKDFDEFWMTGLERGRLDRIVAEPHAPIDSSRPLWWDVSEDLQRTDRTRHLDERAASFPANPIDEPPVTPQVWWRYATVDADQPVSLLIEMGDASEKQQRRVMDTILDGRLQVDSVQGAFGFGVMVLNLTFDEFVARLLPMTEWASLLRDVAAMNHAELRIALQSHAMPSEHRSTYRQHGWFLSLLAVAGFRTADGERREITFGEASPAVAWLHELLRSIRLGPPLPTQSRRSELGRVSLNRPAWASVARSKMTAKADAAQQVFNIATSNVRWAVLDTGIDARHVWFRRKHRTTREAFESPFRNDTPQGPTDDNFTRVIETYDFTTLRSGLVRQGGSGAKARISGDVPLPMHNGPSLYLPPENGHGTHVAGILGGEGGLCPDIQLLDYRVLDRDGGGDEFAIVAALRHILNRTYEAASNDPAGRNRDLPVHGVNLSLSLDADVTSDACGWSLICRTCDELVRAGVIVVVSAGNTGFEDRTGDSVSTGQDFRTVSITDPANTERVISVGSTDPDRPQEFGVSYFSGRGPTADGRRKPDLVAPGERIASSYGFQRRDLNGGIIEDTTDVIASLSGTSMAAAHVSGAAAMVIGRHRELIGKPDTVKHILLNSATDLGRDPLFQGHGLVDILRAIQTA